MEQKQQTQLYKVRPASHNEQVIHAPKGAVGWYSLTVHSDGSFTFKPVVY
jgi:hypothetical protein